MNKLNIVVGNKVINYIKSCKHFKTSLGLASTMTNKQGDRILNKSDEFAISYNYQYKTTIYKQGSIGNIDIYLDHLIRNMDIATYYDLEELILQFDIEIFKEKGIDFIIGSIIKSSEENFEKIKKDKEEESKVEITGNMDRLKMNPGAVNYKDILDYMNKKRRI